MQLSIEGGKLLRDELILRGWNTGYSGDIAYMCNKVSPTPNSPLWIARVTLKSYLIEHGKLVSLLTLPGEIGDTVRYVLSDFDFTSIDLSSSGSAAILSGLVAAKLLSQEDVDNLRGLSVVSDKSSLSKELFGCEVTSENVRQALEWGDDK